MHFTKLKNRNANPSICIPAINPGELKEVTPTKCMWYLGLWFDPQLKFHEHTKIAASKASRATKALCMLGNSTSSINQLCLRQSYLCAILPIMTYGSVAFWDGKSNMIKDTLTLLWSSLGLLLVLQVMRTLEVRMEANGALMFSQGFFRQGGR